MEQKKHENKEGAEAKEIKTEMEEKKHEHKENAEVKEIKTEEVSAKAKKQQQTVFVLISALVLLLLAVLVFKFPPKEKGALTLEEAKVKTENFINENLMMPGAKAIIESVEEEYGLYKLSVDVGIEENIESYIDKKGVLFFPEGIEIDTYVNPYLNGELIDIEELDDENGELIDIEELDDEGEESINIGENKDLE